MVASEVPNMSVLLASMKEMIKDEIQSSLKVVPVAVAPPALNTAGASHSGAAQSDHELEGGAENDNSGSEELSIPEEDTTGKPLCPLEDVDFLVKEVRSTMQLEEQVVPKSVQDIMFGGLEERKKAVFPVHRSVSALIKREWSRPDRKGFVPRAVKRKYPFNDSEHPGWDHPPKIDVAIAKVSKKGSLPFEDLGTLKDPMDKKADGFLKRTWEAAAESFRPSIAGTCVARSMLVWLAQLEEGLQSGESSESLLASLPRLKKSASFLADASADTLRFSARSAALSNSARRAIWLKNWSGDAAAKTKLCNIPCEGNTLFGSVLEDLLEKAGDKKKGFPVTYQPGRSQSFRVQGKGNFRGRGSDRGRGRGASRSRGYLFNQKSDTGKKPTSQ
ncbi:lamina-associated polypeptide 2, isoforms alpha/zeta-like [Dendropsophus ebraccatus]|uniref:lamina-associated polypeptide 2, isoforms alpha/zeta-like n=1 Tax=Dendropsophus ebraccatus TaxID=150705 RepID=UPI003831E712